MRKIIFDLDHTLFDTTKWRDAVFMLLEEVGVAKKDILETFEQVYLLHQGKYDTVLHLNLLTENAVLSEKQHKEIKERYTALNFAQFLIPGTQEMLPALSPNNELWLLTRGIPRMQKEKIARSSIDHFFEERVIVVPNDKMPAFDIIDITSGDVFVNDHMEETTRAAMTFPLLRCVLFKRDDRTYEPSPPVGIEYLEQLADLPHLLGL